MSQTTPNLAGTAVEPPVLIGAVQESRHLRARHTSQELGGCHFILGSLMGWAELGAEGCMFRFLVGQRLLPVLGSAIGVPEGVSGSGQSLSAQTWNSQKSHHQRVPCRRGGDLRGPHLAGPAAPLPRFGELNVSKRLTRSQQGRARTLSEKGGRLRAGAGLGVRTPAGAVLPLPTTCPA